MFSHKTKVILDTNALMLLGKGIDIFILLEEALDEPYQLCTYQGVLDELTALSDKRSQDAFSAKLALIMAKQKALKILTSSSQVHIDDTIVEKADAKQVIVTLDKVLLERLRKKGVRTLSYRQKKFAFQGG